MSDKSKIGLIFGVLNISLELSFEKGKMEMIFYKPSWTSRNIYSFLFTQTTEAGKLIRFFTEKHIK